MRFQWVADPAAWRAGFAAAHFAPAAGGRGLEAQCEAILAAAGKAKKTAAGGET